MMAKSFKNRYKAFKGKAERLDGSVYTARGTYGKSEDVRMRQIMDNDYGKRASKEKPMPGPLPGFARRTMITS